MADKFVNESNAKTLLTKVKGYTDSGLATKQNTLTTAQQNAVDSGITSGLVSQIGTNQTDISNINDLIPSAASVGNQLADKNFVNSTVGTNTANFIGTFSNIVELENYSGTLTNNDYAFVTNKVINQGNPFNSFSDMITYVTPVINYVVNYDYAFVTNAIDNTKIDVYRYDISKNTIAQRWGENNPVATAVDINDFQKNPAYNRYKYTTDTTPAEWLFEYTLNNSSFTAQQWAAINSGITADLVSQIGNSTIIGASDPTAATVGEVGQFYLNTTTKKTWMCVGKVAQGTTPETYTYTWEVPSNLLDTSTRTQNISGDKTIELGTNSENASLTFRQKKDSNNQYAFLNYLGFGIKSDNNNGAYTRYQQTSIFRNKDIFNMFTYTFPNKTGTFALLENITANAFATSKNYTIGDLTIYQNKLYKCITAHTGTWNTADFTEVTVADILGEKADVANCSFKKIPVPSSTTLTDDEIANIILGCQIDGNFLNLIRPTLFPAREIAGSVYRGVMIGYLTGGNAYIGMYEINKGTKVISQLAQTNNLVDLRSIANLYIGNYTVNTDQFGQLQIGNANTTSIQFDGSTIRAQNIVPIANNQKDLGSLAMKWKDLYLAGNLSDGTNSVSVTQLKNKANESIIADAYDSTSTYAVGDFVIYNNVLYKCTTAVTVAEDFNSNKWTSTIITDELGSGGGSNVGVLSKYEVEDIVNSSLYTIYPITATVTNGTYIGNAYAPDGDTAQIVITPNSGYVLPSSITVTNASYNYNDTTGVITISGPTGSVSISVNCISE